MKIEIEENELDILILALMAYCGKLYDIEARKQIPFEKFREDSIDTDSKVIAALDLMDKLELIYEIHSNPNQKR